MYPLPSLYPHQATTHLSHCTGRQLFCTKHAHMHTAVCACMYTLASSVPIHTAHTVWLMIIYVPPFLCLSSSVITPPSLHTTTFLSLSLSLSNYHVCAAIAGTLGMFRRHWQTPACLHRPRSSPLRHCGCTATPRCGGTRLSCTASSALNHPHLVLAVHRRGISNSCPHLLCLFVHTPSSLCLSVLQAISHTPASLLYPSHALAACACIHNTRTPPLARFHLAPYTLPPRHYTRAAAHTAAAHTAPLHCTCACFHAPAYTRECLSSMPLSYLNLNIIIFRVWVCMLNRTLIDLDVGVLFWHYAPDPLRATWRGYR